jgi:uncharacterized damage-inducible protein DinB
MVRGSVGTHIREVCEVNVDDIGYLFGYDRWATETLLDACGAVDRAVWERPNVLGERGIGGLLVHHLGSTQRWRIGLRSRWAEERPRPEDEPLLTVDELRERWAAEWTAYDEWISTMSGDDLAVLDEGVPVWQLLAHVVNHGTQHRSEAAALLTVEGHSPGDLDMFDFAEAQAAR